MMPAAGGDGYAGAPPPPGMAGTQGQPTASHDAPGSGGLLDFKMEIDRRGACQPASGDGFPLVGRFQAGFTNTMPSLARLRGGVLPGSPSRRCRALCGNAGADAGGTFFLSEAPLQALIGRSRAPSRLMKAAETSTEVSSAPDSASSVARRGPISTSGSAPPIGQQPRAAPSQTGSVFPGCPERSGA
jgi:hypothetical protein